MHGDLRQHQRDRAIQAFRNKDCRILVATDIAARGLDISHIEHVINYDLPQCPEDYIHRIGRTARAGAEGAAVNLLTPQDGKKWSAIRRLLNPGEKQVQQPRGAQEPRKKKSNRRYRPHGRSGRPEFRSAAA
ncbi:MAG: helicase-related protein [Alphaproteobacteria bacterium]